MQIYANEVDFLNTGKGSPGSVEHAGMFEIFLTLIFSEI